MKELVLKAEELKQLLDFVGEIPGKFSTPILNFINAVGQKRLQEAGLSPTGKAVEAPVAETAAPAVEAEASA
jgi:hypothetical protein